MARLPRFVLPGHPQHVIIRGNDRQAIFCTEEDYRFYLNKLKDAVFKHGCELHAFVLMTNHVHLLITPYQENAIGKVIQMLGRYYVQYFNLTYRRTGTLWEGRYKAALIDSDTYALTCYRYIELNPVRAGMVKHPAEYPWSSYRYNAMGRADGFIAEMIKPHSLYKGLGPSPELRQARYQALFESVIPQLTLEEIREMTNKAWLLGSDRFREEIEARLNRRCHKQKVGRPKMD